MMNRELCFATPVYIKDVGTPEYNKYLEEKIIAWSKQDKGVVKTNVNGWHSETDMHEKLEYKHLVEELYIAQEEIYKEEFLDNSPRLGNMWANINYKTKEKEPQHLCREVHFEPVAGRLIMFPAWLNHMVETNQSDEPRISISFNFLQKGMFV